jgi:gliding motility-associated-like protein
LNEVGEQVPFNGNGYLGQGFSYHGGDGTDGYSGVMWWEYVQGQLTEPLEQGEIYKISMEISLAEISSLMLTEIGAYFSKTPISSPNSAALAVIPQCVFYEPNYYRDTVNWIHLEDYFIAQGGEEYITIGNFKDNLSSDTLRIANSLEVMVTYFYIDHVVLTPVIVEEANIFTPNNDGINDFWTFHSSSETHLEIVNRWGNLVYKGNGYSFSWDGENCTDGVYYYRIYSNENVKSGFIELIR